MDGCSSLVRTLLVAAIISISASPQSASAQLASGQSASAQSAGIRWRPQIEAAKTEARQTGRLVLVHFWTPTCAPCRRLEHAVFNQPTVGRAIESQFVPVKLNVNAHHAVAQAYGVTSVPTDVIITPDGQPVGKLVSPPTPTAYLSELTQIVNRSKNPANQTFAVGTNQAPAPAPINSAYANLPVEQPQGELPAPVTQTPPYTAPLATGIALSANNRPQPPAEGRQQISNIYSNPAPPQVPPKADPSTQPAAGPASLSHTTVPDGRKPAASHATLPPAIEPMSQTPIAKGSAIHVDSSHLAPNPNTPLTTNGPTIPPGNPPLAFDGFCPVSMKGTWQWIPGDVKWGAIHRGRTYLFAGEAQQRQFLADPDQFSPVLSGADAVIAVDQQQRIDGRREHGLQYNGQFYLFSTEASLQQFSSNPEKYAQAVRQAVASVPEKTVR